MIREIDIYENQKYFCRQAQGKEREILTTQEILTITGLPYKELQYHLWESGKYGSGATFDYVAEQEVQSFHIYNR